MLRIMKRIISFVFLLAFLASLGTGCDFIRASLGKPTSKDLVKISDELKAREQFLRDSIAAVRAAESGQPLAPAPEASAPAAQRPEAASQANQPAAQPAPTAPAKPAPAAVQPAAQPAAPVGSQALKHYYAVAGAFKNPEGAQAYINKLQAQNLSVHVFDFKSGLMVVCLEGHDDLQDARQDVAKLKELHLSDSDPWVYNTQQKLHK